MSRIVFLLEERSMQALLDALLPRLVPGVSFSCIPHEGKQDLERSIPRKLRAWNEPSVRFIVVRDNDSEDCRALKAKLAKLCASAGRDDTLVRIACQELEAWYFGELEALAEAYGRPRLAALGAKARYREPDAIQQPSRELEALVPEFQKISGARRMGNVLTRERNRSPSFHALIDGVRALARAAPRGEGRHTRGLKS